MTIAQASHLETACGDGRPPARPSPALRVVREVPDPDIPAATRAASASSATRRSTSRSPAMITSASSSARLRSVSGTLATVITKGVAFASVKKGASQSRLHERVTTATGTVDGP